MFEGGMQTAAVMVLDAAAVLITACSTARANIWEVTRVNLPFIAVLVGVLLFCTFVPAILIFLVELFYR